MAAVAKPLEGKNFRLVFRSPSAKLREVEHVCRKLLIGPGFGGFMFHAHERHGARVRRHYAPTLDAWAERFDRNWERIHAIDPDRFDGRFRRIWRVYLHGCAEMFRSPSGLTHLFQIVFSRGNATWTSYPRSRAYMYADGEPRPADRPRAGERAAG